MERPDQQLINECDVSVVEYIEHLEQTLSIFKSMEVVAIKHADETIRDGLLKMFDESIKSQTQRFDLDKNILTNTRLSQTEDCRQWVKEFMNALITGEAK